MEGCLVSEGRGPGKAHNRCGGVSLASFAHDARETRRDAFPPPVPQSLTRSPASVGGHPSGDAGGFSSRPVRGIFAMDPHKGEASAEVRAMDDLLDVEAVDTHGAVELRL